MSAASNLTGDFESGVNGSNIQTSDTGSLTPWDSVTLSGNGAATYSNTQKYGALAGKMASGASGGANVVWSTSFGTQTDHYGRMYFYWNGSLPSADKTVVQWRDAGTFVGLIQITGTSGQIKLADAGATHTQNGSVAVSTNQWVRIEWHIIHSTTVGQIVVKLFNSADSTSASDTITSPSNWNTHANATSGLYGLVSTNSSVNMYLDNIMENNSTFPGPANPNPATGNYSLQSFGFGGGGTANSTTGNYALEGITGEASGQTGTTTNYNTKPGYIETQQANVPKVTVTNPSNYYDKLNFVIDPQDNPSDALYALQVCVGTDFTPTSSSPTCSGTTLYVKSDDTLGATLTTSDYQSYATWGALTGTTIIGLTPGTTYYIHAKATQGKYTESGYGPSSNAATSAQSISFCLYSNANCGAGGSSVAFGALLPATLTNSPNNIGIDFATNADNGGNVYIYSANGGLKSTVRSYTITSATADISSTEGFGAQIASVSQTSGGPLNKSSPYNGAGNNVGIVNSTVRTLLTSANPIVGGTSSLQLKTYISYTAPPATDYSELITIVAAAEF